LEQLLYIIALNEQNRVENFLESSRVADDLLQNNTTTHACWRSDIVILMMWPWEIIY